MLSKKWHTNTMKQLKGSAKGKIASYNKYKSTFVIALLTREIIYFIITNKTSIEPILVAFIYPILFRCQTKISSSQGRIYQSILHHLSRSSQKRRFERHLTAVYCTFTYSPIHSIWRKFI